MTRELASSNGLKVITRAQWGPDLHLVRAGEWREMVGPTTGATCRSLYDITLEPGAVSEPLSHDGEAAYYMVAGSAVVVQELATGAERHALTEGSMFHAHAGTEYRIESADGARLVGGPCPVDTALRPSDRALSGGARVSTYHRDRPGLKIPFISRDARLVVWLGAGARTANMNYVILEPGERNKEHVHAESEDTIHILEGHGTAENVTTGERVPFGPGDTIHIEIGIWHAVAADRGERVVSVGGPCPADTDMLRAAGVDVDSLISAPTA